MITLVVLRSLRPALVPVLLASAIAVPVAPATESDGVWGVLASLPSPRQEFPAALLGRHIYVAGGFTSAAKFLFSRYDIESDSWEGLAPLPIGLHHTALAAAGGRVYIIGGISADEPSRTSDRIFAYDPSVEQFTERTPMPFRTYGAASVVYEGRIYVFGGRVKKGENVAQVQIYDPAADRWTVGPSPMPLPRDHIQAVVLGERAYVSPGRKPGKFKQVMFHAYHFPTETWETLADLPEFDRSGGGLATIDGNIYYIGGENLGGDDDVLRRVQRYGPGSDTWTEVDPLPVGVHGIWAVVEGRRIYVPGGGTSQATEPTDIFQVYDLDGSIENRPPIASDDNQNVDIDVPVSISVLDNDRDPDGSLDPASVSVVAASGHGAADPDPDGTVRYVPDSGYTGPDSFRYTVSDLQGAVSNEATVHIDVSEPVDPQGAFVQDDQGVIGIEAEHFAENTPRGGNAWDPVASNAHSGGNAMAALPDDRTKYKDGFAAASPQLEYAVEFVSTGSFSVWLRGLGAHKGADSVHIGLDGGQTSSLGGFKPRGDWVWSDGASAHFDIGAPGIYTLFVWMRESGFELDKIAIIPVGSPKPTGFGPAESQRR